MNQDRQMPQLKIGDKVTFTNDYGVVFPNKIISGIEYWKGYSKPRYFYSPSDTPWYSTKEENLKLDPQ
jgi:hypothetical protein